jgi:hypothetical protein
MLLAAKLKLRSKHPVRHQVREPNENFPLGRSVREPAVEARIEHQVFARAVTQCPQIPDGFSAEERLSEVPDFT